MIIVYDKQRQLATAAVVFSTYEDGTITPTSPMKNLVLLNRGASEEHVEVEVIIMQTFCSTILMTKSSRSGCV